MILGTEMDYILANVKDAKMHCSGNKKGFMKCILLRLHPHIQSTNPKGP